MLPRTGYNISVRPIFAMFMTCGNLAVSGSKKKLDTPVLKKYLAPVLKKSGSKKNFPVAKFETPIPANHGRQWSFLKNKNKSNKKSKQ